MRSVLAAAITIVVLAAPVSAAPASTGDFAWGGGYRGRAEVDGSCGDGIIFSIEHGTRVVEAFALPRGSRTFEHDVGTLQAGEVLYFIVDPGANSQCDTTRFNVIIDTR